MWQPQPEALWCCGTCKQPDATTFVIVPPYHAYCEKCKAPLREFGVSPVHESALYVQSGQGGNSNQSAANTVPKNNTQKK